MALNLETSFATVVHRSPPRARLETAFVTIVHTAPVNGGNGKLPAGAALVRKRHLVGRFAFQFVPKVEE